MPGKSRHGKGKHPHHSKKSKIKQRQATMSVRQDVTAEAPEHTIAVVKSPHTAVITSPAKAKAMQYPYITGELRRISILTGIIVVILIVLALVLS
jgi:hypothetical protein